MSTIKLTVRMATASLGAVALVAGASLVLFRGCASKADLDVQDVSSPAASVRPRFEIPTFRNPVEAKRYFGAMVDGDRRALALLNQALAEAKSNSQTDDAYIAELQREHALRTARMEVMEEARAKLGP
jgi:hypothetical protein